MSNEIIRPIGHNLGFDEHNQLWASWPEGDATHSTIVPDLREKTCCLCNKGWELTGQDFRDHVRVDSIEELAHSRCYNGHASLVEADMWHRLLCAQGAPESEETKLFIPWCWKKIPNGYWPAAYRHVTPWFLVKFKGFVPKLKLGSRKRVWHLSLHDLTKAQLEAAEQLFKDVNDTKWVREQEAGVHAWTEEQAKQYINWFRKIVLMDKPVDNKNWQVFDMPKAQVAA